MHYKLLIFDWDGTVMDSGDRITNCFCATAQDFGLPAPNRQQIRSYIGISLSKAWHCLYPHLDAPAITSLISRYREYWIYLDKTPMPLFDGVMDGLEKLTEKGYWLEVATGKSRAGLDRAMEEASLSNYFAYTRCADESRSKPHPQMLLDILDFTGINNAQALMIGDTTFDLEMAENAGMDRLAVGYGYHNPAELSPLVSAHFRQGESDGVPQKFDEVVKFISRKVSSEM